eukprot:scaffold116063_cov46-Phaeocystis_antarctica.AAC.1
MAAVPDPAGRALGQLGNGGGRPPLTCQKRGAGQASVAGRSTPGKDKSACQSARGQTAKLAIIAKLSR